jgi:hypothetical protein
MKIIEIILIIYYNAATATTQTDIYNYSYYWFQKRCLLNERRRWKWDDETIIDSF